MRQRENRNIFAFLLLWSALVATLFFHASGKVDIPLFHFPQAKGILLMVQEGYKHTNLVGLREEVYAIPQGVPFIHPLRIKLMRKKGIFVAHSMQEAQRMVDAGTENIEPRLILEEKNFQGHNLYRLGDRIYAVPAMDPGSGAPLPAEHPYREKFVGANLEEAKRALMSPAASGK